VGADGGRGTNGGGRGRPGQTRPLILLCRDPIGEELEVLEVFCKIEFVQDVRHPFRTGGSMRDALNHDTQELATLFKLDTESHHVFVSFYTQAGLTKQKVLK
jgi:hypothetical protein